MGKRLGNLIRSARTDAGLTQAALAGKLRGVSTTDIGRYERGEAEPTQQVVKEIAKICGVTQKSLLDAMPKTPAKPAAKTGSSSTSMRVSATEKRLVELYRAADAETKKKALAVLRGTDGGPDDILEGIGNFIGDVIFKKQ